MALTDIALCSRALLKLGANTISSFDEGTVEAEIAGNLYGSIRDALLSAHPWNFATGQADLNRLTAVPVADFAYAYQLPTDFLRVLSAGLQGAGRGIAYRIAEKKLHTDAETVTLTYIFRPDETGFPPFFDQALIALLAAEFALPVTESVSRMQALSKAAEKQFAQAKTIDAQEQEPPKFEDFSLIDVRA